MSPKKSNRYRLKPDEIDIINDYRRIKQEADDSGLNVDDVHSGWIKSDKASLYFKNPDHKKEDIKKLLKDLVEDLKQYSPEYKPIERPYTKEGHLFFCCPSDLHIGKLCKSFVSGEEYNNQIAVIRALEGVRGCISKARGFEVDKVLLLLSGDLLHVDGFNNTTTSGTRQDTDGLFSDNFMIAKRLMVDIIELLVQLADVHVMFTPGNHDHISGWLMAQVLQAHFRNCKEIYMGYQSTHEKIFSIL